MVFSVIIPAHNREKEISRAIHSVLRQSFPDFEIIVIDDGSTDSTRSVVDSIQDNRIHYFYQENSGATAARNSGIIRAQGRFVSFLDSDDEWLPTMLERQYLAFQSDPEIGLVYSNVSLVDQSGKVSPFPRKFGVCGNSFAEVLEQGYLAPTTVISIRRECFAEVGMFDVDFPASQDDDMCFRMAREYKIGYLDESLARMYVGPGNRISRNFNRVAQGWWLLWKKFEPDVLRFCGRETMARHYYECVGYFAQAGNAEMANIALQTAERFGWKTTFMQKAVLKIILNTSGIIRRGAIKLQRI